MLQATLQRLNGLENLADPIIICSIEHRFIVAEQLQQIGINNSTIILEPQGRNTAPAIAAVAHYVTSNEEKSLTDQSLLLILSADHIIQNIPVFHDAIKTGSKQALNGNLVAFGVTPNHPHTGYGYIKIGETLDKNAAKIKHFKEKPSHQKAKKYYEEGDYLWNSGMFLFESSQILKELSIYCKTIFQTTFKSVQNATNDLDFVRLEEDAFLSADSISIDYALMEKTDKAVVITLNSYWNDIGSWSGLYEIGEKDQNNNVIGGDVISINTSNSYIKAEHHLVAVIGVENLIIVDTPDATLIANKGSIQQVKQLAKKLQEDDRYEEKSHRKVYRPWGWYNLIDKGSLFQVKRICVKPGASLSLQRHFFRAEHWIVVKGIAKIINGDQNDLLIENQSTYIPVGELHRLENPGSIPLEIIEVQTGSYLGEDDIERVDDKYGR
jgi:mannose-1-phosphate guanylyltransferase/mannose-6-phosphate isomerase